MRASTRYTTAVHLCIFLAHLGEAYVSSAQLAESVNTNPVVIRRLVHDLIEHGIMESAPGPRGGFRLTRSPENITLAAIYQATREEELFRRPKPNADCVVSSNLKVLLHDVFEGAEARLVGELESTTIADLTRHLRNLIGEEKADEAIRRGE